MKQGGVRNGIDEPGFQMAELARRDHVAKDVDQKLSGIFDLLGEGNRISAIPRAGLEILLGIAGRGDGPTVRFAVVVCTDEFEVATLVIALHSGAP